MADNNTSNRGFASMDENKQKKIASKGGKASGGGNNRSRGSNASGAAGRTEAAKRGGEHSHDNQYTS